MAKDIKDDVKTAQCFAEDRLNSLEQALNTVKQCTSSNVEAAESVEKTFVEFEGARSTIMSFLDELEVSMKDFRDQLRNAANDTTRDDVAAQ